MTPTFSRSWLMKMTMQFVLAMTPASLRSAWLIRRACRPTKLSPISPSISARGTSAATESTTTTSIAPERTSASVISSACSPVSGWETSMAVHIHAQRAGIRRVERVLRVDEGDLAAQLLCLRRATCSASVVLPEDSGP